MYAEVVSYKMQSFVWVCDTTQTQFQIILSNWQKADNRATKLFKKKKSPYLQNWEKRIALCLCVCVCVCVCV